MISIPAPSILAPSALALLLTAAVMTSWLPDDQVSRPLAGAIFLCGAAYLAGAELRRTRIYWDPTLVLLGAMAAWSRSILWTSYLVLFFLALQLFAKPEARWRFRAFAVWFGGAYSLYAIAQYATAPTSVLWLMPDPLRERVFGTFYNRNHYAALMELLLPIALWELLKRRSLLPAAAAALIAGSVVISASRTGIILIAAEIVFVLVMGIRRIGPFPVKKAITSALVVLTLASVGGTAWRRFSELKSSGAYEGRRLSTEASIAMIREHPLTGVGAGNWAAAYPRYATLDTGFRVLHADDDWLEWTAEHGLPFLGLLIALFGFALMQAWREPWGAGAAAVLVHAFTEFPLHKPAVMCWLLVLLAASAMARRQH